MVFMCPLYLEKKVKKETNNKNKNQKQNKVRVKDMMITKMRRIYPSATNYLAFDSCIGLMRLTLLI